MTAGKSNLGYFDEQCARLWLLSSDPGQGHIPPDVFTWGHIHHQKGPIFVELHNSGLDWTSGWWRSHPTYAVLTFKNFDPLNSFSFKDFQALISICCSLILASSIQVLQCCLDSWRYLQRHDRLSTSFVNKTKKLITQPLQAFSSLHEKTITNMIWTNQKLPLIRTTGVSTRFHVNTSLSPNLPDWN